MAKYDDQLKAITGRAKVRVYKPIDNPDDRNSLCGAPVQRDEEGNQYFDIPAHAANYQGQLHPHYTFGDVVLEEDKRKAGRPAATKEE